MRRIVLVLALLAAALAVPSPAIAVGALTTVVSKVGLPAAIDGIQMACPQTPSPDIHETAVVSHVFGAGFPPLGKGSLAIQPAADQLPGLGMIVDTGTLADLTTFDVSVRNLDTRAFTAIVLVRSAGAAGDRWALTASDWAASFGYATHSIVDLTYTWFDQDANTTGGSGTIAQFLAAQPQQQAGYAVTSFSGNCAHISTRPVYFDHLDFAISGTGTRWDFESRTGGLSIAATPGSIAAGDYVRLSTVLRDGGLPVANATVSLWARPNGAAHFVKIRTVAATSASGAASARVRPAKTTTYQWRHAVDAHVQATTSWKQTVQVTQ